MSVWAADEPRPFARVVVGIDDTPGAYAAAAQAAALLPPDGVLHLCAVAETRKTVHAGLSAPALADQVRVTARAALDRAAPGTSPATALVVEGEVKDCLLAEIDRRDATLLALGTHDNRRTTGLLLGAAGSVMLRDAPCHVLVARPDVWPGTLPERVVVGVDASPHSDRAAAVAEELAARIGARLTLIVGVGGKLRDPAAVLERHPEVVIDRRAPVDALVAAARAADLVVVGSRGLHGWQALGSVSERVAHRAPASVLVVRSQSVV